MPPSALFEPTTPVVADSEQIASRVKKTDVTSRLEALYGGPEELDSRLQEMGLDLTQTLYTGTDKKRYANIAFLSFASGSTPKDIVPKYDIMREAWAKSAFGKDGVDDEAFYGLIQARFQKERSGRQMAHDLGMALSEKAVTGGKFEDAYNEASKGFRGKPGWDDGWESSGVYEQSARRYWNQFVENAEKFAPDIEKVEQFFATTGGFDGDADELADILAVYSPQDAAQIIDIAVSRQKQVQETVGDGMKAPFAIGAVKGAIRFGRESGRLFTAAGEEIVHDAKIFPWWSESIGENEHKNAIKRRLQRHATGDLDPTKADSWFGERMAESAQMLPFMLAASSWTSMPVAYAALKNDTRTQLIDSGVPEEQAAQISLVAAPIVAAIEQVQAKVALFGKWTPGLKPLKGATIRTVAQRLGVRIGTATAIEVGEEFAQEMTTPLVQELWAQFDKQVQSPDLSATAKEFWKRSPELMVSMLPLVSIGAGFQTKGDVSLALEQSKLRTPLAAAGYLEADIDAIVQAARVGKGEWMQAMRNGFANRNLNSEQAKEAQDLLVAEIEANKVPDGYEANFAENGDIIVEKKEDGSVVTRAATADEATKAMQDAIAEDAAKRGEISKTEQKKDFDRYMEIQANLASKTGREKVDYFDEIYAENEALKNKYGAMPPTDPFAKKEEPPKIEAAEVIAQPVATPSNDGSQAIPVQVALNKKEIEIGREVMDLLEMQPPERQKFATVMNQVKVEGSQSGAIGLAKNILANDRPIETKEHAQLLLAMAERYNAYETLLAYQDKLIQEGRQDEAKAQALIAEAVLEEIDLIQNAASRGGTRLGQALAARRNRIDRLTYDLVPLIQRARRAKGENLTPEQQEELRKLSQQIVEQQAKIAALEQELAAEVAKEHKDDARTFVNEGVSSRSKAKRGEAKGRRDSLKKQLAALGYRMNDITNAVGLSYEAASIVSKIAETYIEEGAATLSEVTGKLKAEIPDLTENDIYNALGGRIKKAKKQIESEADRRVKELKKQAGLWADIHNLLWRLEDGKEKAEPLTSEKVKQLREIVTRLRHQANRAITDAKQLAYLEEKFREIQNEITYGYRAFELDLEQKQTNPEIEAAREKLKQARRERYFTDVLLELEDQIRTGEFDRHLLEKGAEKNPVVAKLRERADALRGEIKERKKAEGADEKARRLEEKKAQEEIDRITALEKQISDTVDQLARGYRLLPEAKRTTREKTEQEERLRSELRELERLMRTEDSIADLQEQIRTGDFKISNPEKRILKNAALNEALARRKQLQRQVENRIENLREKTVGERIVDLLLVPRALQSTLDFSFIGRQGLILGIRDPMSAIKSTVSSAKAMFSEMTHDQIAVAMERHPNYRRSLQAGIQYSELDGLPNKREEHFMTNLAEKIPGMGVIVRAGNRGMITYLNLMRLEAYTRFVEAYPDASLDSQKAWSDWVNKASGKGYIGKDVRAWNVVFYAPKYAISRYQVLLAPFKHWSDPTVRKEIGKDIAAFTLFAFTMMGMAALAGLEVEDDPQSSDFGKVKVGNVSYDLLGGMQQPIRLAALTLFSAGKRDESYRHPIDTALSFLHYKLNPAVTVPVELWTGKDFLNRPISVAETMMSSVTPIILQETYSALTEAPEQTPLVVLGSTVGVGTTIKEEKKSKRQGRAQP